MSLQSEAEVVVVGGGISGLYAARLLAAEGRDVIVLEASNRVGGRTFSRRVGRGLFDLGGQWIGPGQDRMYRLTKELGLHTFRTFSTGTKLMNLDGTMRSYSGSIPRLGIIDLLRMQVMFMRLNRMVDGTDPLDSWNGKKAAEFDRITLAEWVDTAIGSPRVRAAFDVAIRVIFGAEPREMSLRYFLTYVRRAGSFVKLLEIDGGAQQDRFVESAYGVSLRMAEALGDRVVLGAPVTAIRSEGNRVVVDSGAGTVSARRAILAVPPTLHRAITLEPPFEGARKDLVNAQRMGATIKVVVTYERTFWRDTGLSGEAMAWKGPIDVAFDGTSSDGAQPALVAFIVGDAARELDALPAADRRNAVLDAFAEFFGPEAKEPTDYAELQWCREPWVEGCPTSLSPPLGWDAQHATLREPVGNVHFAGTETAVEWEGYMEGALEAAERAVREVTSAL